MDKLEIYVVDNDSKDGSVEMVRESFPEVIVIANKVNVGFSTANNQAIKQTKADYVVLLNPDTLVKSDTFEKTIQFMDITPDCGGLGVKMIDGNGKFLPDPSEPYLSKASFRSISSSNLMLKVTFLFS